MKCHLSSYIIELVIIPASRCFTLNNLSKEKLRLQAKQEETKFQLAMQWIVFTRKRRTFFPPAVGSTRSMRMNCWQVLQKDSLKDDNVSVKRFVQV